MTQIFFKAITKIGGISFILLGVETILRGIASPGIAAASFFFLGYAFLVVKPISNKEDA